MEYVPWTLLKKALITILLYNNLDNTCILGNKYGGGELMPKENWQK